MHFLEDPIDDGPAPQGRRTLAPETMKLIRHAARRQRVIARGDADQNPTNPRCIPA